MAGPGMLGHRSLRTDEQAADGEISPATVSLEAL
jgi:hypothetical protein